MDPIYIYRLTATLIFGFVGADIQFSRGPNNKFLSQFKNNISYYYVLLNFFQRFYVCDSSLIANKINGSNELAHF